ncbi:BglG family transcription antiterminator [Sporolactobacillus inulinus]|uniref:Transcriptional regulator n=1 Tax=Sporolactobacillus inulinus CASD TaxID=1069536 RepID=A0A0U1QNT1_9BACL|nr:BglG family transcription antiterminator [Sporolactobacillus inulinus]KLI02276.1 transcriptional regulator [Sporolactobacillus inulinus CASD]GEB77411.1 transcriptional regulator MtlR [Sporolactobacillus inulinus]
MVLTNREKMILELLLKTSGKHSALSIASYLQVSVRTVRRDLKNIERLLAPQGLQLVQNKDKSLCIQGANQAVFKLVQELANVQPVDLSAKERKLLLFLKLFQSDESMKMGPLAHDLAISSTTLTSDLDDLSDWTNDFGLTLSRKRGVGIQLIGSERAKRTALANFYLFYFNENLIEAIFQLNHQTLAEDQLVLHYFKANHLIVIDQAMKSNMKTLYAELADSDYISFLIQVCIAVQRYASGHPLQDDDQDESISTEMEALPFVGKIAAIVKNQLRIDLPVQEKAFMVTLLKGSRLQNAESIYFDQVITGKAIKKLIQHVSQALHMDLTNDFSLFQGLMAHLEPSLFRIRKDLASVNPLTKQIKTQYSVLFQIIERSLREVFQSIRFPDDEIAYIVLHFGSALEQRKQKRNIRALVVCPTGIGASKMLASRLKKEMKELYSIKIASIHDMEKLELDQFDLILSTVHLPKQKIPCLFVNPLLSQADIEAIKQVTDRLTGKQGQSLFLTDQEQIQEETGDHSLEQLMDEIDRLQAGIRAIMKTFKVIRPKGAETTQAILQMLLSQAADDSLVSDVSRVLCRLIEREQLAGLGIPGTDMALFHCRDRAVRSLCFRIAHLNEPIELAAMDGGRIPVRNILLLLAPEALHPMEQEVIRTVSSSLVDDRESTLIFASANETTIRAKLEANFYQLLIHKFK